MTVIQFEGLPRTGKTLFMTFHGHTDFLNGYEIFSNYKLMFDHSMLSPYDMLKIPFDDVDRHPKTLMIQEVDKWFDSRRSMRNENVYLSSLTGQSGKRNLNIYVDTQYPRRVDTAIRDIIEYKYHAMVYIDSRTKEPLAFKYTMTDADDNILRELPPIPAIYLKPYYDMYDSYEATQPIVIGKSKKELNRIFNEDKDKKEIETLPFDKWKKKYGYD